jgi:hypothetical protein
LTPTVSEDKIETAPSPPKSTEQQELLASDILNQQSTSSGTAVVTLPHETSHLDANENEAKTNKKKKKATAPLWTWRSIRFRIAFMLAVALSVEGFMRSNINMVRDKTAQS